jgi:hypothetical protein
MAESVAIPSFEDILSGEAAKKTTVTQRPSTAVETPTEDVHAVPSFEQITAKAQVWARDMPPLTGFEVEVARGRGEAAWELVYNTGMTLDDADRTIMVYEAIQQATGDFPRLVQAVDSYLASERPSERAAQRAVKLWDEQIRYRRTHPLRAGSQIGGFGLAYGRPPTGVDTGPSEFQSEYAQAIAKVKMQRLQPDKEEAAIAEISKAYTRSVATEAQEKLQTATNIELAILDAAKQRDQFGGKTWRRWERGVGFVASGGIDLIAQLQAAIPGGETGQGTKEVARSYYQVLDTPEMQAIIDNWFDKTVGTGAEMTPFIAATMGASFLGGPSASFVVAYGVEGNGIYQKALDNGVDEREARIRGVVGGLLNASIELGGGSGRKYLVNAIATKTATRMAKIGRLTKGALIVGVRESVLEEVPQGMISDIFGSDLPVKADGSFDLDTLLHRRLNDAIGGFVAGVGLDLGTSALRAGVNAGNRVGARLRGSMMQTRADVIEDTLNLAGEPIQTTKTEDGWVVETYATEEEAKFIAERWDNLVESAGLEIEVERDETSVRYRDIPAEASESEASNGPHETPAGEAQPDAAVSAEGAAPVAAEAPAAAETRQPWEMTKADFTSAVESGTIQPMADETGVGRQEPSPTPERPGETNSKIADVVYHYSDIPIETFTESKSKGIPGYFVEQRNPKYAEKFGDVVTPVKLDIRTPLDLTSYATGIPGLGHTASQWLDIFESHGIDVDKFQFVDELNNTVKTREDFADWADDGLFYWSFLDSDKGLGETNLSELIREAGYDGIKAIEDGETVWVPFSPGQISNTSFEPPAGQPAPGISHAQIVQQAVSEGKPVPRHVLEEYKGEAWADEALAKLEETTRPAAEPTAADGDEGYATYRGTPVRIVGTDGKGLMVVRDASGRQHHVARESLQAGTETAYRGETQQEAQRRRETSDTARTSAAGSVEQAASPTDVPPEIESQSRGEPLPVFGTRNAVTERIRQMLGLDGVPTPDKQTQAQWLKEAIESGMAEEGRALELAAAIVAGPRVMSGREDMAIKYAGAQLMLESERLRQEAKAAQTDAQRKDIEVRRQQLDDKIELLTRAAKVAGTEWGRAGVARQADIDDDGNLQNNIRRFEDARGKPATANQRAKIEKLTDELVRARQQIEEMKQQMIEKQVDDVVQRARRTRTKTEAKAEAKATAKYDALKSRLTALLEAGC